MRPKAPTPPRRSYGGKAAIKGAPTAATPTAMAAPAMATGSPIVARKPASAGPVSVPALPARLRSTSRLTGCPPLRMACVWEEVQKIARAAP